MKTVLKHTFILLISFMTLSLLCIELRSIIRVPDVLEVCCCQNSSMLKSAIIWFSYVAFIAALVNQICQDDICCSVLHNIKVLYHMAYVVSCPKIPTSRYFGDDGQWAPSNNIWIELLKFAYSVVDTTKQPSSCWEVFFDEEYINHYWNSSIWNMVSYFIALCSSTVAMKLRDSPSVVF